MAYNPTIGEREAAAGLTNTMSGRGLRNPTIDEREVAAGLTLAGNRTTNPEFERQNTLEEIQDEINREASLIREDASRARRSVEKRYKNQYREAINIATDTRVKRELKRQRDNLIQAALERIEKIEAAANEENINKVGAGNSIHQDSIDKTGSAPDNAKENPSGVGGATANTFTLDVVKSDNTAGTATFNGSGVN